MSTNWSTEEEYPAPLPFERRVAERWPMEGMATAMRLSSDGFGRTHELVLQDYSWGGLSAISEDPIEPGTLISIGFDRPDCLARRGIVQRCIPCGNGYRVGVQFQLGLAA